MIAFKQQKYYSYIPLSKIKILFDAVMGEKKGKKNSLCGNRNVAFVREVGQNVL